jgi:hypothetical protein
MKKQEQASESRSKHSRRTKGAGKRNDGWLRYEKSFDFQLDAGNDSALVPLGLTGSQVLRPSVVSCAVHLPPGQVALAGFNINVLFPFVLVAQGNLRGMDQLVAFHTFPEEHYANPFWLPARALYFSRSHVEGVATASIFVSGETYEYADRPIGEDITIDPRTGDRTPHAAMLADTRRRR